MFQGADTGEGKCVKASFEFSFEYTWLGYREIAILSDLKNPKSTSEVNSYRRTRRHKRSVVNCVEKHERRKEKERERKDNSEKVDDLDR